jgi:hypothetical protein
VEAQRPAAVDVCAGRKVVAASWRRKGVTGVKILMMLDLGGLLFGYYWIIVSILTIFQKIYIVFPQSGLNPEILCTEDRNI